MDEPKVFMASITKKMKLPVMAKDAKEAEEKAEEVVKMLANKLTHVEEIEVDSVKEVSEGKK